MLIVLSGKKQAGKNSIANFLAGEYLRQKGQITGFSLDKEKTELVLSNEPQEINVKIYSFADALKVMCVEFFELRPEQVYGSDQDKNTMTPFKWEDMPLYSNFDIVSKNLQFLDKKGQMTAREFMQVLGTDIMRKIYGPIWVNFLKKQIAEENMDLGIICDCRFPNEVEAFKEDFVIRLTRAPFQDSHPGENALDNHPFQNVLDNANMTYEEQNYHVFQMVKEALGWEE